MSTVLYLAFSDSDGGLNKPALEALSAVRLLAQSLGTPFAAGLIGGKIEAAAATAAAAGAARVLGVAAPQTAAARYATDAAAAEAVCRSSGAQIVVAPGSTRVNRIWAGVAHRLGGAADLHITKIEAVAGNAPKATRWFYRQRMMAEFTRPARPWLMAVDPGAYPPFDAGSSAAPAAAVQTVAVAWPATRTQPAGFEAPSTGRQTIRPDADLLFVAGAGWTKKQADGQTHLERAEKIILGFLDAAKASLGSSKSLVDLSGSGQAVLPFMSHLNQVGQTGSTPRHPKGLATCCHGEEPHVVGWRFITERRAVNLDPNCGWARGKADVLYVADAFAVMEKVLEILQNEKSDGAATSG
ncbi:MAG: electron transfer flavoprotein subunit alpha/FixB family protein [Candidatus Sumerlaeia bacterium]